MNISKSFSFPFEDKSWFSKLLLGAVIAIVPILNFALLGYVIEIARRAMNGSNEPLPAWDDLGKKWMDGFYNFVAGFIYGLPVTLVLCLISVVALVPVIAAGNGNSPDGIFTALTAGSSILILCILCLVVFYVLLLSVLLPGILVHYAETGTFSAFFKLGEVFNKVSQNMGTFFTAWIVSLGAGLLVGLVTGLITSVLSIIPCVGWIGALLVTMITSTYIAVVYGRLFGEYGIIAYRKSPVLVEEIPPTA
jgi:hypothetical protein